MQTPRRDRAGRRRVRRGPGRRRRRLRRGALRARAIDAAGLTLDEVVEAILAGFAPRLAWPSGIVDRLIVTAMRQFARSVEIAELAVRYRDEGVVGFDVAGPEAGFPPTRYLDAFQLIHHANFHLTIHAGEAFGLPSIWEALQWCGAERLGPRRADRRRHHGRRRRRDQAGPAGRVRARPARLLEMCPTSNVHTGAVASIEEHPIDLLRRLRFRVTVNTDNRLMSGVTMRREFETLARTFGFGLDEMQWLTLNAMKSAFAPFDQRLRLINGVIKPGYARLMAESDFATAAAPGH